MCKIEINNIQTIHNTDNVYTVVRIKPKPERPPSPPPHFTSSELVS